MKVEGVMFKAEYIGNISHLIGETALCSLVDGELLVQFDNRELETWELKGGCMF